MARVTIKQTGSLDKVAKSDALGDQLEAIASPVLDFARQDPNTEYTKTLRMKRFVSRGKRGRVSVQVGAAPTIGGRVESKRGTLSRALGRAGL